MGVIRSQYKKNMLEDVVTAITAGTADYYFVASNPSERTGNTPVTTTDDQVSGHELNWNTLFGKKLANNDAIMMIQNIPWTGNTIYTRYDDTVQMTYESGNSMVIEDFYVVVPPGLQGGYHHVYKCINNANGSPSTIVPSIQDYSSFTLTDGYTWRYIYSISATNFNKFGNDNYVPVTPNAAIVAAAMTYAGIDIVKINNAGSGYSTYHDGTIQSVVSDTSVKIATTASTFNDHYVNSAIYIYNDNDPATSQLRTISAYVSNTTGRWITFTDRIDTSFVDPLVTRYKISPSVVFDTDGDEEPQAYTVINTTSNSIGSIVVVEPGSGISRASARVVANSAYGSGASISCIVPPPGGHGSNPVDELKAQAVGITFSFIKSEGNTIPISNITYNKVGIIKNPHELTSAGGKASTRFTSNTFDQRSRFNLSPSLISAMSKEEIVIGQTSGAKGKVVSCNTSVVFVVGDKDFSNGEIITSANSGKTATINIIHTGDVYMKDVTPLYVHNINDVDRSSVTSEAYKLVIKV
jgi:hypothetical protein